MEKDQLALAQKKTWTSYDIMIYIYMYYIYIRKYIYWWRYGWLFLTPYTADFSIQQDVPIIGQIPSPKKNGGARRVKTRNPPWRRRSPSSIPTRMHRGKLLYVFCIKKTHLRMAHILIVLKTQQMILMLKVLFLGVICFRRPGMFLLHNMRLFLPNWAAFRTSFKGSNIN